MRDRADPRTKLVNVELEKKHLGALLGLLSLKQPIDSNTIKLNGSDFSDRRIGETHDLIMRRYKADEDVDHEIVVDIINEQLRTSHSSAWRDASENEIYSLFTETAQG